MRFSVSIMYEPKGTAEESERRRRRAIGLLSIGCGIREVARRVGVAPGSVVRWRDAYEKAGTKGLEAKPHPGCPARLSQKQREKLMLIRRHPPLRHTGLHNRSL
ncbi:MAG: helix-turn-helix domain-containing protein [Phycisphaerae bacterium]|nr:helix-turn-helix domain-containing protein [Phycisphaerae bacterium]